jgi:pimeloyl-ACP methyl ester carboxylesterase
LPEQPTQERRARVNGVDLAYEARGSGQPLLFIHGGYGGPASSLWPGPRLVWHAATDGFRTINYDRRCAGRSEYVDEPFTLHDIAQDARALLEQLDATPAVLVASSAGGPIGLEFVLRWPQLVSALVLVNTGPALMHESPPDLDEPHSPFVRDRLSTVRERAELVRRADDDGMRAAIASRWDEWRSQPPRASTDDHFEDHLAVQREALDALPDGELAAYAAGNIHNMRATLGVDFTAQLGELRLPTLVAHGDQDTVVPFEYGQILAQRIPDAEFRAFPGAGHGLFSLPEVQESVFDWLRSLD